MEDKQYEWWTHAIAQQEVIITGSTASMKWETTNDWNTIVIPNDLYVTFRLATVTWLAFTKRASRIGISVAIS